MKDRIQTILNLEKVSAASFAGMLGIQRSTLSNILGGRNNPSFDIIQTMLTKLPNLNSEWLLLGKGQPFKNPEKNLRGDKLTDSGERSAEYVAPQAMEDDSVFDDFQNTPNQNTPPQNTPKPPVAANITKVILLYSDGTFKPYDI